MTTRIKTTHEEEFSDKSKILGVLLNYSDESPIWKESFVYLFITKDNMYIFFNTIIDMVDYLLYGETKMKRAYMEEEEFDNYYDASIDGDFKNLLKWIN